MRIPRVLTVCAAGVLLLGVTACGGGQGSSPAAGSGTGAAGSSDGFDAQKYFAGKTIRVIVNTDPGTGTDLYARFIADPMAKAIPGNPRITVTNVDGLGGTATIYTAPEKDLIVGVGSRSSQIYTTASDPAAQHDPTKIRVIGGIQGDSRAWTGFSPIVDEFKSLTDATGKTGPALRMPGAVGSPTEIESDLFLYPWVCEKLQLSCEYVKVAQDTSTDVAIMAERGEVNTLGGRTITSIRDFQDAIKEGKARILFEYASNENELTSPDGSEIPDITSLLPDDAKAEYEQILPIISSGKVGNPFWVGPSMPDGAVAAMRDAFAKVMSDQTVVDRLARIQSGTEEGEETDYEVIPITGQAAQDGFDESVQTFQKNSGLYTDLQQRFWDEYWR
jgi:hypothetical protein